MPGGAINLKQPKESRHYQDERDDDLLFALKY
jgi:hypothetical protein